MNNRLINTDITNLNTNRNYQFDNIKAILIFSVVLAHYLRASSTFDVSSFGGELYITSFSYIMQGFFFISGFFSKNVEKCRKGAFKTFLFPYLILMPVMYGLRFMVFGHASFNIVKPTMALWFLLTMFYYRFFLKDLVRFKYILPVSIIVSLIAGMFPMFNSHYALGRTLGFLPFFLSGYYCRRSHIEKIQRIPSLISQTLLLILVGFSAYMSDFEVLPLEAWYYKSWYGSMGMTTLEGMGVRFMLSIVALAWIVVFLNLIPKKKTFFTNIGRNTMTVYILHIIIRYFIKDFGGLFGQDIRSYFILIAMAVATTWYLSKPAVSDWYNGLTASLYAVCKGMILYTGSSLRRLSFVKLKLYKLFNQ